jgi:hypothetical protein
MTDLTNVQFNHKFEANLCLTIHIQNVHPFWSKSEFSGRDVAEDNYRFCRFRCQLTKQANRWRHGPVSVRKRVTFRPLVSTVKLPFSLRGPKKMYRINLIKIYFYIN